MAQNLPDAEVLFRSWASSHTSITDLGTFATSATKSLISSNPFA